MKRIGVLSDTHGRLDVRAVEALAEAECDLIVHAGDIGNRGILDELRAYGDVRAVLGNNDFDEYGPDVGRTARFSVDGVRFLVAHYPRDVRVRSRAFPAGEPLPHGCIHGHTHVPEILCGKAASPATLVFCPGSASWPRGASPASVGFIDVEEGRILCARVVSLSGTPLLNFPLS